MSPNLKASLLQVISSINLSSVVYDVLLAKSSRFFEFVNIGISSLHNFEFCLTI